MTILPKGWYRASLGDDIKLISGQHLLPGEYNNIPDGTPYLTGPADYSTGKIITTKFTKEPKSLCRTGDILITVKGSGTGKTIIADKAYCISRQLMAIQPKSWDRHFVWLVLCLHDTKYSNTSAGLIPGITRDDVLQTPILVPPIIEQKEISRLLRSWDHVIALTESLIDLKHERQSWLMHQFLNGKKRFPGFTNSWLTRTMNDLVDPVQRSVPKPNEPYKAIGIRSHCKGTFERVVNDPSTVDMEELFVVRKGDLIVNITFAWEGAIAFVPEEHDGHLVSHRFPMYRLKEDTVYEDFFRYVIIQPRFIFELGLISPGGAGRNRVMSKRDFLGIEIRVPCLDEQLKIGRFLRLVDREITLLKQLHEVVRVQKKGIMQQLLTGKKRIKVG